MLKRLVSLFFVILFSITLIGGTVWASDISTYDISGHEKTSILSISNKTATCKSTYRSSGNNIESITIVQTLEKNSWFIFWGTIGDECTKTVYNTGDVSFINYKYNLDSGTYRVKSVFTVKLKDGRTETITVYSSEHIV